MNLAHSVELIEQVGGKYAVFLACMKPNLLQMHDIMSAISVIRKFDPPFQYHLRGC